MTGYTHEQRVMWAKLHKAKAEAIRNAEISKAIKRDFLRMFGYE